MLWTILRYLLTGRCGYACCYLGLYGFVPEACCPIHDSDSRLAQWAARIRKHKPEWMDM